MDHVLKIQTGFIGFVKRSIQRIKYFYWARTNRFYIMDNFDDGNELPPEMLLLIEEIVGYTPVVPDFNPSATVLFTTNYIKKRRLNKQRILLFRYKVRQECKWLFSHGYTDFIVNYGSNYGIITLLELLELREKNEFNLCFCKVRREHANCITESEVYKFISHCFENGGHYVGIYTINEFIEKIIAKVSMISCEAGLIKSYQKIPHSLYDHYHGIKYY